MRISPLRQRMIDGVTARHFSEKARKDCGQELGQYPQRAPSVRFPPHGGSRHGKVTLAAIQKPARRIRMASEPKPSGRIISALMKD
jgi:hypothetical protein